MADLTEVYSALQKADAAGDSAGAKQLADYIRTQGQGQLQHQMMDAIGGQIVPSNSATAMNARSSVTQGAPLQIYNPFGNNIDTGAQLSPDAQNFLAGAGKATTDLVRGAGQMAGMVSRQDVADSRALDAPLMQTGAGKWGYVAGTAADLLPAAWIPGAGTFAGAAAIGAGAGLLQPSTSTSETLLNVGLGGLTSPAALLAGRGVGAVARGGWAAIEPLLQGGQQRIAARALQSFAGGPQAAADAANTIRGAGGNVLPGVQPTTAELANNAGLSQLERSLRNNPEYLTALTDRNQANRGVLTSALDSIAGTPGDLAAATLQRAKVTSPLYAAARDATAEGDSALTSLLGRPSMQSAWQRAQTLAKERGDSLVIGKDIPEQTVDSSILDDAGKAFTTTKAAQTAQYSGKAIQYLKMSLNDAVNQGEQRGMGAHELGAMKSTLASLNDWTQLNLPSMRQADATFAGLSKPINQMELGQALTNKLKPALSDFGNNTRLNSNAFAGAVRNGDALAARVTGQENSTLANTLSMDQLKTVIQVGEQLARRANADELGRAVGSNTGQNLISQNILRQVLGPLGLPQSMTERAASSALGQSVLRPVQWLAKAGEPRVMDQLAQASLDPKFAARLLSSGVQPSMAHMIWARQGLLGPLAASVAYSSQQ